MARGNIPDARRINGKLDIRKVAAALEIRRSGNAFHCWKPENHAHGDADPSVRYWRGGNRLRCFVCDRTFGPVDLAIDLLRMRFVDAVRWIAEKFEVPHIPARKKSERRIVAPGSVLAGEDPITFLVRSHVFSQLSAPTRSVAPVLLSFSDYEREMGQGPRPVKISYRALGQYSGLKSPNAIRKAIEELEVIGWLEVERQPREGLVYATGRYRLTPYSQDLIALGNTLADQKRQIIQYERAVARERKEERQRMFRASCPDVSNR
jgi:hypothetical protein